MHLPLLLLALAAGPDGGPRLVDSPLGQTRAGQGAAPLLEQWWPDPGGATLARLELQGDALSFRLYHLDRGATADAGPVFSPVGALLLPGRILDLQQPYTLPDGTPALWVESREDTPDEEPRTLTLIDPRARAVFQQTVLAEPAAPNPSRRWLGAQPLGFSRGLGAQVWVRSEPKWLEMTGPRGPVAVGVGAQLSKFDWQGGKLVRVSRAYEDGVVPLPGVQAEGHAKLHDGSPATREKVAAGQVVTLRFPAAPVRLLRVAGCGAAAPPKFTAQLAGKSYAVDAAEGLLGAGAYDLGPQGGSQVLLALDSAVTGDAVTFTWKEAGCVSELTVH
jgi:hypothetical protein